MQDKEIMSPGKVAWIRLKKQPGAMAGLIIISLAVIFAAGCYYIVPDPSLYSNSMSLPVSLQKPGFKVEVLKVPVKNYQQPGVFERLVSGNPGRYNHIPVSNYKIQNDSVYYTEFGSDLPSVLSLSLFNSDDIKKGKIAEYKTYILGTDRFGRDLLSRLIVATRVSLSVGLIAVAISLFIGTALGSLAGYFRGWTDKIILWIINVVWSIPTLLLVVAITLSLGKGFAQVFIAVGLTMWVEVARVVRGQFFSLREQQFVEAGKALGYKNPRIIIRHILPNIMGPVIVIAASNFASAILLEAGLSFLGMGAQPPMPSWGMMIKENYGYIVVDAAYLAIWPGVAIALMVLSFTLLGNGLRDAFDVKGSAE